MTKIASEIGIGLIGGGYMGKAHAVAYAAVGTVFNTSLRPRLEMIAASNPASAERYRAAYGFKRAANDWQTLVNDPKVDALVIASPQDTHLEIAKAAFALGKPVFCGKAPWRIDRGRRSDGDRSRSQRSHQHGRLQLCAHPRHAVCP